MLSTARASIVRASSTVSGGFGQVTSLANGFHARQMQIVARFEF